MSKISEIIFKGEKHYITSNFGNRTYKYKGEVISDFHRGTDYGTDSKKIPQYAIEDGVIHSCGTASDGAKYVQITYPRINKRFRHWHLDSISVKSGQKVQKYTELGKTGATGQATGIHLHLGIIDLATDEYIDPEAYAKSYIPPEEKKEESSTDKFKIGDEVIISGKLYKSANAEVHSGVVTNKRTKITRYVKGTKHPYNTTGDLGWIDEVDITLASNERIFKKGDKVTVKQSATKYCTGETIPSFVKGKTYTIHQVGNSRYPNGLLLKEIYSWVDKSEVS